MSSIYYSCEPLLKAHCNIRSDNHKYRRNTLNTLFRLESLPCAWTSVTRSCHGLAPLHLPRSRVRAHTPTRTHGHIHTQNTNYCLSFPRTHARAHTHTHTHTYTHTHLHSLTHTGQCIRDEHAHTHTYTEHCIRDEPSSR